MLHHKLEFSRQRLLKRFYEAVDPLLVLLAVVFIQPANKRRLKPHQVNFPK